MNPEVLRETATNLIGAYRTGKAIRSIRQHDTEPTLPDAYEIQREQLNRWSADGESIRGFKVGLASVPAQKALDATEPILGRLTGRMIHPEHQPLDTKEFIRPRIEPALAFVLRDALRGPGVNAADAIRAVDFVLPALEISDSRIQDGPANAAEMTADNAGCGGVVLGGHPVHLPAAELRLCGCVLYRNGEVAATGAGGMALGSPLNALVWAANAAPAHGTPGSALEPGHLVIVPSLTTAVTAEPGDTVATTIAGVGSVTAVLSR